jgi:hypothetical protein
MAFAPCFVLELDTTDGNRAEANPGYWDVSTKHRKQWMKPSYNHDPVFWLDVGFLGKMFVMYGS